LSLFVVELHLIFRIWPPRGLPQAQPIPMRMLAP
jgi:hypothetical protein